MTAFYTTTFPLTEGSISENGAWLTPASPWTPIQTAGGRARGTQTLHAPPPYDDSWALLTGFSPDQACLATVDLSSPGGGGSQEIELILRGQIDPQGNGMRGYEVDVSWNNQAFQVVRLNGPVNDFTVINAGGGFITTNASVLQGDQWYAEMMGNIITVKCKPIATGVWSTCATIDVTGQDIIWTRGNPGVGAYIDNVGGTPTGIVGWGDFTAYSMGDTTVPTVVQAPAPVTGDAAGTTLTKTVYGVAAGSALMVHVGFDDSGGANSASVADLMQYVSNPEGKVRDTSNNQGSQVFRLENAYGGRHDITVTFNASISARRMRVYEISGVTVLDQSAGQFQASAGTGSNGVSSGASAATKNANDLVLAVSQDTGELGDGTGTVTAGTGFAITGPTAQVILVGEWKNVSSTGAQTATFTQSVNNARVTHVLALKAATAAPTIAKLQARPRRQSATYDFSGAGWFDVLMERGGLFDRDMILLTSAGNVYSVSASDALSASDVSTTAEVVGAAAADAGSASDSSSMLDVGAVTASDSGAAADSASTLWAVAASASDSGTAADAATSQRTGAAVATDAGTATDASTVTLTLTVAATDAASASDSASSLWTVAAAATDSGAATDAANSQATTSASASDSGTATDSATAPITGSVAATDSGTASDSSADALTIAASASDAGTASDASTDKLTAAAAASDAGTATDSSSTTWIVAAAAADSVTAADSASMLLTETVAAADSVTASDASTSLVVEGATASDSGTASDSSSTLWVVSSAATDALTAADAATDVLTAVAAATDSVTAADASTDQLIATASASESSTASDSSTSASAVASSASDSATASDSSSASLTLTTAATDSVTASDASTDILVAPAAATDSVTASDASTDQMVAAASASDSGTATDSASTLSVVAASASDSLSAADSSTETLTLTVAASDSGAASDSSSSTGTFGATASDSGSAADASTSLQVVSSSASDSGSADDSADTDAAGDLDASDSLTASDSATTLAVLVAAATEPATAVDSSTTAATMASIASDSGSADDLATASTVAEVSAADSVTASDAATTLRILFESITEALTSEDQADALMVIAEDVLDSVTANDIASAVGFGSGIDPFDLWNYPIEGSYTAADLFRLMAAVLAGRTTIVPLGNGQATVTFEAIDQSDLRVTGQMSGSERTATTFELATPAPSSGVTSDPANVWNYALEGSYSVADTLRLMAAVLGGKDSTVALGHGQAHIEFRAVDDSAARVVAEMQGSERAGVTLTP